MHVTERLAQLIGYQRYTGEIADRDFLFRELKRFGVVASIEDVTGSVIQPYRLQWKPDGSLDWVRMELAADQWKTLDLNRIEGLEWDTMLTDPRLHERGWDARLRIVSERELRTAPNYPASFRDVVDIIFDRRGFLFIKGSFVTFAEILEKDISSSDVGGRIQEGLASAYFLPNRLENPLARLAALGKLPGYECPRINPDLS